MDISRAQLQAVLLSAGGLIGLLLGVWWLNQPVGLSEPTAAEVTTPTPVQVMLFVDVQGKVREPGLYELPIGSRVFDAIQAAGGLKPKSQAEVNQARILQDGEQLWIGESGASTSTSSLLNLNQASAPELEALPGVGPVLAQRIVQDRETNGNFKSVADLDRVSGVGDHILRSIAGLVTCG